MPRDHRGAYTDRPDDLVVGVLGGMGPLATVDFFHLLVRLTPVDKDWNHLHIIVDNAPRMPSRTRAFLFGEESPAPYLLASARRLEAIGAALIVVPCNSAAYYLGPAREGVRVPIIDPVIATAEAVRSDPRAPRRPLVLGGMVTHRADLYGRALANDGITPVRPTDTEQEEVAALIEALKRGDTGPASGDTGPASGDTGPASGDTGSASGDTGSAIVARTEAIVGGGMARGADSVILGCTEFGLIADALAAALPVFNSNELLARRTLALARRDTSSC